MQFVGVADQADLVAHFSFETGRRLHDVLESEFVPPGAFGRRLLDDELGDRVAFGDDRTRAGGARRLGPTAELHEATRLTRQPWLRPRECDPIFVDLPLELLRLPTG